MSGVVVCHPGSELYGSDRMALETVRALRDAGEGVKVVLPADGPLAAILRNEGVPVAILDVPVLRKELLRPLRLVQLLFASAGAVVRAVSAVRRSGADVVITNTLTQPIWLLAARLAGRSAICHVREVENDAPRIVRGALVLPLALAKMAVCNSIATERFVVRSRVLPVATRVIYNGKDWAPYFLSRPRRLSQEVRLVVVGRLSPRKGQDVAIDAVALLRARGICARLTFVGDTYPGYEWYEGHLRERVAELGLNDDCRFTGFVSDVAPALADADVMLVPSRIEPFGTVAAEGMAAMRLVVVARTEGLVEIVEDGRTGLTFEPGDAESLADAISRAVADPDFAERLAEAGFREVRRRFSQDMYRRTLVEAVRSVRRRGAA